MKCTKAIIPVAGYGTRRLPITKAVEKCMLPLLNRPIVDYVVEDCVKAGITDIFFVVSGPATQLRDYYSRDMELERYLKEKGKDKLAESIRPPKDVSFHYIEQDLQDGRYGTAVPLWLCRDYLEENENIVYANGDATLYTADGLSDIERMVASDEPTALGIQAPDDVDMSKFGVVALTDDGKYDYVIDYPEPGTEPSRIINAGMYVLPGIVTKYVDDYMRAGLTRPDGEYIILSVISNLAKDNPVNVMEAKGKFLDAGSLTHWVEANSWLLAEQERPDYKI